VAGGADLPVEPECLGQFLAVVVEAAELFVNERLVRVGTGLFDAMKERSAALA
jgi:hypothetical protein